MEPTRKGAREAQARPATRQAPDTRALRESPVRAAATYVAQKTSYFRMAFANPYNLSLLFGGLAVSGLAQNPLLAFVTVGAEALWLLYAPESKFLRRVLWDRKVERERLEALMAQRAARLNGLPDEDRGRFLELLARQAQIQRLAAENPSFAGDLLRTELTKTDRLVDAFLEMAETCARYEQYLRSVDVNELERDRRRYEQDAKAGAPGDAHAAIAKKNLAILTQRLAKVEEIRRYLGVARGQLDLIENSFQLIADQIVTMRSPQELSGQLDELLDGVEAIRETARDTEQILGTIEREL